MRARVAWPDPSDLIDVLDDEADADRIQRGELVKLDPTRSGPVDATAVARFREHIGRQRWPSRRAASRGRERDPGQGAA